jgi:nitroimidazol reductase NimA-like FMN-containing flavoprotein (pyridoxamine 5'-phosphate oxidase superfamily)
MRRKEKAVTDLRSIEAIIQKASVCRLGMFDSEYPYIVPLCFGYENKTLYFHSAGEGKKIDLLRNNSRVCFEMDLYHELKRSEKACGWGMKFKSVIGFGTASFITDLELKKQAVDIIMRNYSDDFFSYSEASLQAITVISVAICSMEGKTS